MRLMCRIATATGWTRLHQWKKGRRVKGFRVRRRANCRAKQEETFPGGGRTTVRPTRRKRVQVQSVGEEPRANHEEGRAPL